MILNGDNEKKHNSKLPEQPGKKMKSAEKLKILIPV